MIREASSEISFAVTQSTFNLFPIASEENSLIAPLDDNLASAMCSNSNLEEGLENIV